MPQNPPSLRSGLILSALSVILTVLLAEGLLRVLQIGYGNSPMVPSPLLHHEHPRNYRFTVFDPAGEYGGHIVSYDSLGRRVNPESPPPQTADRTVALVGDSFTEANQVAWGDSFGGLLEKANPQVRFVNLGVSSYSPLIYALQVESLLASDSVTDIVVQLYANDFRDDSIYLAAADARQVAEVRRVSGDSRRAMIYILRHSYLARLIRKVQLQLQYASRRAQRDAVAPASAEPMPPADALDSGTVTQLALARLAHAASQRKVRLYLFAVPSKALATHNSCCDADTLSTRVRRLAVTLGAYAVPLDSAFAAEESQRSLFFPTDIHFSAKGHFVTGRTLAIALRLNAPTND